MRNSIDVAWRVSRTSCCAKQAGERERRIDANDIDDKIDDSVVRGSWLQRRGHRGASVSQSVKIGARTSEY